MTNQVDMIGGSLATGTKTVKPRAVPAKPWESTQRMLETTRQEKFRKQYDDQFFSHELGFVICNSP
jgi:hypothetical protein